MNETTAQVITRLTACGMQTTTNPIAGGTVIVATLDDAREIQLVDFDGIYALYGEIYWSLGVWNPETGEFDELDTLPKDEDLAVVCKTFISHLYEQVFTNTES